MHIPDGFLAPPVWLSFSAVSAPTVAWLARRVPVQEPASRQLPLVGAMGAFVFAAQMVNFPVGLGASGHLLGGSLLAVTLGPRTAALTMSAVLILQAVLFQDGGVLALGANIFNMALAGVAAGYFPVRLWGRSAIPLFLGGFLSVLTSALLALVQLQWSGAPITGAALSIALTLFAATAILEGVVTVLAVRAIERLSPQSLPTHAASPPRTRLAVTVAALLLLTGGVWAASADPDALQDLAARIGVDEQPAWPYAPFAGYQALGGGWLGKSTAGLAGAALVYAMCTLAGKRR